MRIGTTAMAWRVSGEGGRRIPSEMEGSGRWGPDPAGSVVGAGRQQGANDELHGGGGEEHCRERREVRESQGDGGRTWRRSLARGRRRPDDEVGVLGHRAASTGAMDGEVGAAAEFGDGGSGRSDRVVAEAAERSAGAGGEEAWVRSSVDGGLGRGGPALGRAGWRRRAADMSGLAVFVRRHEERERARFSSMIFEGRCLFIGRGSKEAPN